MQDQDIQRNLLVEDLLKLLQRELVCILRVELQLTDSLVLVARVDKEQQYELYPGENYLVAHHNETRNEHIENNVRDDFLVDRSHD